MRSPVGKMVELWFTKDRSSPVKELLHGPGSCESTGKERSCATSSQALAPATPAGNHAGPMNPEISASAEEAAQSPVTSSPPAGPETQETQQQKNMSSEERMRLLLTYVALLEDESVINSVTLEPKPFTPAHYELLKTTEPDDWDVAEALREKLQYRTHMLRELHRLAIRADNTEVAPINFDSDFRPVLHRELKMQTLLDEMKTAWLEVGAEPQQQRRFHDVFADFSAPPGVPELLDVGKRLGRRWMGAFPWQTISACPAKHGPAGAAAARLQAVLYQPGGTTEVDAIALQEQGESPSRLADPHDELPEEVRQKSGAPKVSRQPATLTAQWLFLPNAPSTGLHHTVDTLLTQHFEKYAAAIRIERMLRPRFQDADKEEHVQHYASMLSRVGIIEDVIYENLFAAYKTQVNSLAHLHNKDARRDSAVRELASGLKVLRRVSRRNGGGEPPSSLPRVVLPEDQNDFVDGYTDWILATSLPQPPEYHMSKCNMKQAFKDAKGEEFLVPLFALDDLYKAPMVIGRDEDPAMATIYADEDFIPDSTDVGAAWSTTTKPFFNNNHQDKSGVPSIFDSVLERLSSLRASKKACPPRNDDEKHAQPLANEGADEFYARVCLLPVLEGILKERQQRLEFSQNLLLDSALRVLVLAARKVAGVDGAKVAQLRVLLGYHVTNKRITTTAAAGVCASHVALVPWSSTKEAQLKEKEEEGALDEEGQEYEEPDAEMVGASSDSFHDSIHAYAAGKEGLDDRREGALFVPSSYFPLPEACGPPQVFSPEQSLFRGAGALRTDPPFDDRRASASTEQALPRGKAKSAGLNLKKAKTLPASRLRLNLAGKQRSSPSSLISTRTRTSSGTNSFPLVEQSFAEQLPLSGLCSEPDAEPAPAPLQLHPQVPQKDIRFRLAESSGNNYT
ncbi:unnamed protein product [Amoebophrya sp. A120]|nr:unnamed protein product [Amoebophrya sp. A120]|eukprot:GSA120T00025141001.1